MSLRVRITLVAAAAVALAVAVASVVSLLLLRHSMASTVDQTLATREEGLTHTSFAGDPDTSAETREEVNRAGGLAQIVTTSGALVQPAVASFPIPAIGAAVAAGHPSRHFDTVGPEDRQVRVLSQSLGNGTALEVGLALDEYHRNLDRLALDLLLVAAGGVVLAGCLGWVVARTALVPVDQLTASIAAVAATPDLTRRIDVVGTDELARLATDFNRLLAALDASQAAQRRLVDDASHELRTPLTSLRTNIEVLGRADELEAGDLESLQGDLIAQVDELTTLVANLVELARGNPPDLAREEVELGDLVADAVRRAEIHARAADVSFRLEAEPSQVRAAPGRLERAIANLLDNAVKWSPAGAEVEVTTRAGRVIVRDHGPGILPEALPHVFDRFFRAATARGQPGSGLGLAIVASVVGNEGGEVTASNAEGGGARFEIRLPPVI